jgi:hypothetical protein
MDNCTFCFFPCQQPHTTNDDGLCELHAQDTLENTEHAKKAMFPWKIP